MPEIDRAKGDKIGSRWSLRCLFERELLPTPAEFRPQDVEIFGFQPGNRWRMTHIRSVRTAPAKSHHGASGKD